MVHSNTFISIYYYIRPRRVRPGFTFVHACKRMWAALTAHNPPHSISIFHSKCPPSPVYVNDSNSCAAVVFPAPVGSACDSLGCACVPGTEEGVTDQFPTTRIGVFRIP